MKRNYSKKLIRLRKKEKFEADKRAIMEEYRGGLIEKQAETFTKKWTARLTILSAIWISLIILIISISGFLNLSDTALTVLGTVCGAIITEIVVVLWRYMVKSYNETKSSEEIKLERDKLNINKENIVGTLEEIVSGKEG